MQQDPLLATKLYIPPIRPELVSRPRLIERLNAGLHRKFTLVSAPAGFGKTTLLSEWVHAMGGATPPMAVAWLSLDGGDNDPKRFLAYLVTALQSAEVTIGQGVLAALPTPGPVNAEAVLTTLINEIASLRKDLILVLDDYHLIESQPVDSALTFFLDHLPPPPGGVHLVLASRIDPSLPLSRLRASGQMSEIRESDLRFTPDQVAAFLDEAMGLDLSAENVAALGDRTEGWVAGLQLAALSMKGLERTAEIVEFVNRFTGSDRYIQDYLADEVLERRPKGTREFLLQTSILDRLSGPLCDAVCFGRAETARLGSAESPGSFEGPALPKQKDSQATLETLEAANLFIVPLDNERRWYRYHHLFTDLLRQRLHQQQPGVVTALHIRASAWYEANGMEVEALHHSAAANDFERAARLVEGDGNPLYHRGAVIPVLNWLESLQASQLDARPSLWVMYAEVLLTGGRPGSAGEAYDAAEAALQDVEQDAYSRDLLGRIANGRASLAGIEHQPERIIAQSRRALDLLDPNNVAIRAAAGLNLGYAYRLQGDRTAASQALAEAIDDSQAAEHVIVTIFASICLGDVQASENRLHQAAQTYRRALDLAGEQPIPYAGEAHLGLAQILYEWNDLDATQYHGLQGIRLTRQIPGTDKAIPSELLLARLKLVQGDLAGADAMLDEASRTVRRHDFAHWMPEVAATQMLVLLRKGDLAAAGRLARAHSGELPVSQARVHLAQGASAAALETLEPWRQQVEGRGWPDETLKVKVVQAMALHADGQQAAAVQLLGDALAMAEPDGFIRTFVDEGAPMAQLLYEVAARGIMPDYSAKLLAAFEYETKDEGQTMKRTPPSSVLRPSSLVEPLSQRELEVLKLVAQGLSNREISERLFLALDTVKGHNRRIYGKLQVHRRTEAVARARELGLL